MERESTVAEAARTFAEAVNRVRCHGESTRIIENGRLIARIVPATEVNRCKTGTELAAAWSDPNRPRLTPDEAESFEADLKAAHHLLRSPREDPWE